jgi:hypothetical protein
MTSSVHSGAQRAGLAFLLALCALSQGCALRRPPAPKDIDCAEIDRAEERFPDECGEPEPDSDGGSGEDAAKEQASSSE